MQNFPTNDDFNNAKLLGHEQTLLMHSKANMANTKERLITEAAQINNTDLQSVASAVEQHETYMYP